MESTAFNKTLQMGLGEAINRLNLLHAKVSRAIATPDERSEHELILEALNKTKLDLGFDCDLDGVPDTIEIFARTAKTSCCRIIDIDDPPKPKRKRKTTSRSRRK